MIRKGCLVIAYKYLARIHRSTIVLCISILLATTSVACYNSIYYILQVLDLHSISTSRVSTTIPQVLLLKLALLSLGLVLAGRINILAC